MKKFNFKALLALGLLIASTAYGWEFKRGTYTTKNEKEFMMLRNAPGREGSFMSTIFSVDKKGVMNRVAVYVMDPLPSGNYSLTPITLVSHGELGIEDDNPSLVIVKAKEDSKFKVTSSNSGNVLGYTKSMNFEGRTKKYSWKRIATSVYELDDDSSVEVSCAAGNIVECDGVFTGISRVNDGLYKLRQKLPGVFAINTNKVMATGDVRSKLPSKFFFIIQENQTKGWSSDKWVYKDQFMVLVSPSNYSNVTTIKRNQRRK